MNPGQKFCTECGTPLVPGARFCGQCGHPVAGPATSAPAQAQTPYQVPQQNPSQETGARNEISQVLGIVPFIEQGLLSVVHYTLIITGEHMVFCTWNPDTDEAMSDADDEMTQESCNISETTDEIAHFRAKDWSSGPWQRYHSMPADAIAAGAPGSLVIPFTTIEGVDIVCETRSSTMDKLYVDDGGRQKEFDLMYSQGPFLYTILKPLLGDRVTMADHLHRRSKIDRLLTGQEYK